MSTDARVLMIELVHAYDRHAAGHVRVRGLPSLAEAVEAVREHINDPGTIVPDADKYRVKARVYGAIAARYGEALEKIASPQDFGVARQAIARDALAWRYSERNGVPRRDVDAFPVDAAHPDTEAEASNRSFEAGWDDAIDAVIRAARERRARPRMGEHEEGDAGVDVRRVREAGDVAQRLGVPPVRGVAAEQPDAGRAPAPDGGMLGGVPRRGAGPAPEDVTHLMLESLRRANVPGDVAGSLARELAAEWCPRAK